MYAAEQGREGKGITPTPFPSSREGSGREGAGTAREGKGLPTVPFLPALPIGLPHKWPMYARIHALLLLPCGPCMPPYMAMYARMHAPLLLPCGPCMPLYMAHCCSHVTHVCPHTWPMYALINSPCMSPLLLQNMAPAYRSLLRACMGYYCASPN